MPTYMHAKVPEWILWDFCLLIIPTLCSHPSSPDGQSPINVVNLSRHYPIIPTGNNSKNLIKHLTSTPKNVAAQLIINFDCEAEK